MMSKRIRPVSAQRQKEAYFFILPAFIYILLVMGYPMVYNAVLSLKNMDVKNLKSGTSVFIGRAVRE